MAEAFRSEFEQKMDAKGRVSVPADFIRVLKAGDPSVPADKPRPGLVLVYGGNRPCLQGYTVSEMARIIRGIGRMPNADPNKALLQRNYITRSVEVEVGDDGRIVLPAKARARLGLADARDGAETVFAGVLDKFEIWQRGDYEAKEAAAEASSEALIPAGSDISALLPDLDPED